ncbi:response regulator [Pseudomonadota bacterium]
MTGQFSSSILVVDDDLSVRQSLESFFDDLDFTVIVASSAEEALGLLVSNDIDVAIVDLRLPEKNGEAFILEAYRINPRINFLIYTGSLSYELDQALRQLGMSQDQVFLKPLPDLTVLLESINKLYPGGK